MNQKLMTVGFVFVILVAAFSAAAYQVQADFFEDWRAWLIYLSLEALRVFLVLSNVQIRKYSHAMGYAVLSLSVVITGMIAVMYFQKSQGQGPEFWMLQTLNLLILFCEFSLSVMIEGNEKTAELWGYFEQVLRGKDYQGPELHPDVAALLSKALEYREEAEKAQGTATELERLRDEGVVWASKFEAMNKDLKRAIRGELDQIHEGTDWGPAARELCSLSQIGRALSDTRVSLRNNEYLIFCSGGHGCKPFTINRAQKQVNCPSCGKTHTRESLTAAFAPFEETETKPKNEENETTHYL